MNSDTTIMLVKFLPTILALVLIVLCTLRGFLRGFRKSFILLLHYIISILVGFIMYFNASKVMLSNDLGGALAGVNPSFAEANSLYDVVKILLEQIAPDYAGAAANPYIELTLMSFVGLGVSLVLAIVCLFLIPWVIRFFLYLLYLLFYREGKIKKHILAEGDDYNPHRFLGMIVGAVRGVIWSLIVVSFVSSTYFVLSGGIVQTEQTSTENILLLEGLSEQAGVDLNAVYKGLKESRTTGIGKLFDSILVDGKPIDLYYVDLFLSSSIEIIEKEEPDVEGLSAYLSGDEAVKSEILKVTVREELTLIVNLLESVLETNAITIENNTPVINYDLLKPVLAEKVDEYVNNSVILSDITPLAIIGVAEAIGDGTLVVDEEISKLFTPELINEIKQIDIIGDLADIITIAINASNLIPVKDGQFDFAAFNDINTYFNFNIDPEKGTTVQQIFTDLSGIETLTKVLFPVGVGMALDSMGESISQAGINVGELQLGELDWSKELANIGSIYEKVVALDLDINKLMDTTVETEGEMANNLKYIIDLCTNEEMVNDKKKSDIFKENLVDLIDTIFESDLFGQVGLVYIKSQIAGLEIKYENGENTPLNDALNLVKENLNNYEVSHLRTDLHELVSTCLDVTSLIPLFVGGIGDNYFELIYDIDEDVLLKALFGDGLKDENGYYKNGLYSLSLLNGSFHADAKYAIDPLIEGALKTYASEIFTGNDIDSITSVFVDGEYKKINPNNPDEKALYDFNAWPNELTSLIAAISKLQEVPNLDKINLDAASSGDYGNILPPQMTTDDIDKITAAASDSKLLSSLIKEKLVSQLKNNPTIGYACEDPNIVWMDTKTNDGSYVRGELNSLLKAFVIFSDDKKAMDFNNPDSLINGLAQLIYTEEGNLVYDDVKTFTKSQVLMTVLSTEISKIGSEGSSLSLVIPYDLNSSHNPNAWKKWAYDNEVNYNRLNGEFAKLVTVLYYAREYALSVEQIEPVNVSSEEGTVSYTLTTNNLLNSVVYMEQDSHVTNSRVLHASISKTLFDQVGDESIVRIRSVAVENNTTLNPDGQSDYDAIKKDEIAKAFDVIRSFKIVLINNDFSKIGLKTVLDAINTTEGEDPQDAVMARKSICLSNIFNISTITKFADNDMIYIPYGYMNLTPQEGEDAFDVSILYPTSDDTWQDCEVNKILESIVSLGIKVKENDPNTPDFPEDPIEFVSLLDESKIASIYESKIFAFTFSKHALDNVGEHRDEATYYENESKYVHEEEFNLILEFLKVANVNSSDEMNKLTSDPSMVVELVSNNERIIEILSESNILNINVVNVIKDSPLSFTDEYLEKDDDGKVIVDKDGKTHVNIAYAGWYPTKENEQVNYSVSELYNLLINIAAFKPSVVGGKIIVPTPEEFMAKFIPAEEGKEPEMKVSQVYASDTLALTLTRNVSDIVEARDAAYIDENKNNALKENEVQLLIDFFNVAKLKATDINSLASKISILLDAIKNNENTKRIITSSNILNINVVKNITTENSPLSIPTDLVEVEENGAYGWYPASTEGEAWAKSELARLLDSIVELELDVKYDENNNEVISAPDPDEMMNKFINDENSLKTVYESKVFALTMTVEIYRIGQIHARDEAFENYKYYQDNNLDIVVDNIPVIPFTLHEMETLVEFIKITNLSIDNNELDAEHIFGSSELSKLPEDERLVGIIHDETVYDVETGETKGEATTRIIIHSNIINASLIHNVCVNEIDDNAFLKFPEAYYLKDSEGNKTNNIDPNFDYWYHDPDVEDVDVWKNGELYHLLTSFKVLEIKAHGNVFDFDIEEIIDSVLSPINEKQKTTSEDDCILDVVYRSDIIAATISDRVHKLTDIPHYVYNDDQTVISSMFDDNYHRHIIDEIFHEDQIEYLLLGLESLGLSFKGDDGDSTQQGSLKEHHIREISILSFNENMDTIMKSSILHYVISKLLIEQNQTVNNVDYGIVAKEYYEDSETIQQVTYIYSSQTHTCYYVSDGDLRNAITALNVMGITDISSLGSIDNIVKIKGYITVANGKLGSMDKAIEVVTNSAITNKIFSNILISNGYTSSINTKEVNAFVMDDDNNIVVGKESIVTKADLKTLLNTLASLPF